MLLGAVAVATVGGVTASAVFQNEAPATTSQSVTATPDLAPAIVVDVIPGLGVPTAVTTTTVVAVLVGASVTDATAQQVEAVHEYAAAIGAWADCVSDAALAHTGGQFDPVAACGTEPQTGDFGLDFDDDAPGNSGDAPGHDDEGPGNSENAPGHDDDGPGNSEDAPGHSDDDKDKDDKDKDDKEKDKDSDEDGEEKDA